MSDDSSLSPSLLSTLQRFKRQKADLPQIVSIHGASSNGTNPYIEDSGDDEIQPQTKKKIIYCVLDDDSSDDVVEVPVDPNLPTRVKKEVKKPVPVTTDNVQSKQVSLTFLEDAYPSLDKMVLQDALENNEWSVEKAMAKLCEAKFPNTLKRPGSNSIKKNSTKKFKRSKVDYDGDDDGSDFDDSVAPRDNRVYDSDDSEQEVSDVLTHDKEKVLEFLSTANIYELRAMSSCSQKKAEAIIEQRPFAGWIDLVEKFQNGKYLGTDLLNAAQEILTTRREVKVLMHRCAKLAERLEKAVLEGATSIKEQPVLLSSNLKLTPYQMVGLNWLMVLHNQKVNGILADEMGLGKTIQVIAFIAHLKYLQICADAPHLIIVPASTLDNWTNEIARWCPSMNVAVYYGHPDDRKSMRIKWVKEGMAGIDVILTTYTVLNNTPEEKKMFRVLGVNYVILDEGHMLKNMTTQRYETFMRINAKHRILLTGTPVQNNLLELMSLLTFLMPKMFGGRKEDLKKLFSKGPKQVVETGNEEEQPQFEQQQVTQARRIMKPFVLRRMKSEVLKDLPKKTETIEFCAMHTSQQEKYDNLIRTFSQKATETVLSEVDEENKLSGMAMTTELRKMANHPLLLRYHYSNEQLRDIAIYLATDPNYKDENENYIFDDLAVMSDFQLHCLVMAYEKLSKHLLPPNLFLESGKFQKFDEILPKLKTEGHKVLIFSQFVIMLDVMEEYMNLRNYRFVRLDGNTPVVSRQELINTFTEDNSIFVFLLSTRAGGMGINLTAADTVIIHDIDFNPYNDKQAEDRCHRVGQSRDVTVMRLISKGTIEEGMHQIAQDKLLLERQINGAEDNIADNKNVVCLLKQALGLEMPKT